MGTIADNDEFWPRIVLDLDGGLFIRARDPVEAQSFFPIFVRALGAGLFTDQGRWTNSQITAGTVHTAAIEYDVRSIQRVIGKVACGLAYFRLGDGALWDDVLGKVRATLTEEQPAAAKIEITQVSEPGTVDLWTDRHVALVELREGRLRGILSLYGDCHTVDLGAFPNLDEFDPIVAFCEMDGTHTFIVEGEESEKVIENLNRYIAGRKRKEAT